MLQYTPVIKTHLTGDRMKRFIIEQSDNEFYTSHSGLALIGLCINRFSGLPKQVAGKMTKGAGQDISHRHRPQHAGPALPRQERF